MPDGPFAGCEISDDEHCGEAREDNKEALH
jgi:hypothetical protein